MPTWIDFHEKFLPSRPCSFRNPIFRIPMGRTIYLPIPAAARCNEGAAPLTHHGWIQPSSNSRIDGPGWGWWILPGEIGGEKLEAHQDVIAFFSRKFHEFRFCWDEFLETVKEGVAVYFMLVEGCWRLCWCYFCVFVPHGFLHILHKFFARFLRRERRTKKKCVHSMNGWRSRAYAKHVERCCIHQQDQDRPGTLNNQFLMVVSTGWLQIVTLKNGCFTKHPF